VTNTARPGHVTLDGEYATIEFERHLPYPPKTVWNAITDPEQLAVWYMTEARIDGKVGGRVDFRSGPFKIHVTGNILAWDPPRLFEHEWNVETQPEFPNGERAIIRWEISPEEENASALKLTHIHLTQRTAQGFVHGAHVFLEMLDAYLGKRDLPNWEARVRELRSGYTGGPAKV
jgi:uncharacterized protein YndB with AHSA1/START domain